MITAVSHDFFTTMHLVAKYLINLDKKHAYMIQNHTEISSNFFIVLCICSEHPPNWICHYDKVKPNIYNAATSVIYFNWVTWHRINETFTVCLQFIVSKQSHWTVLLFSLNPWHDIQKSLVIITIVAVDYTKLSPSQKIWTQVWLVYMVRLQYHITDSWRWTKLTRNKVI